MRNHLSTIAKRINIVVIAAVVAVSFIAGPGGAQAIAAACATPLVNEQSARVTALNAYQSWKSTYVTSTGAGGDLRVQRSSFDGYDTVSEGIAYGMLFAAYANDKTTFDGLWAYAQKHVNGNGVMNWRIAADGSTTGWNGATDADEDIAAALIVADVTWGGYRTAAVKQINIVKQHQIESGSYVVKPGDVWGGSEQMNPSYIAPSYYDIFQSYTGDAAWANVKSVGYQVLQSGQNNTTGLFPDWSTSTGAPVGGMGYNYGYDASRAPLRLALSAAWTCDQEAIDLLTPFNSWFEGQNLSTLASSYALNGTPVDRGDATPLLAAATAAAITSTNSSYRITIWDALVDAPSTSYYPDSMRVFGLFAASGIMKSPLTVSPQQPTLPAPTSYGITGQNVTSTVGNVTEVQLSFVAPHQRSNLITDIEVYDADGRRVAQRVYEQQTLSGTSSRYSLSWTPTKAGNYTVKAGIFTSGWAQNLLWDDNVATVSVAPITVVVPPVVQPEPTPPAPVTPVVVPVLPVQPLPTVPVIPATASVSIWWPGSTQAVSGVQPFKAVVEGMDINQYQMFWQVDGGTLNQMSSIHDATPHKLSMVDLQYWTWSNTGRYTINFVAKKLDGSHIAQKSTVITVTR